MTPSIYAIKRFHCTKVNIRDLKLHYLIPCRARASVSVVSEQKEEKISVDCIATYSKGFICSGGSGTLHIFEKTDDKYIYRKTRTVSVWIDPNSHYVATTGADSVPNDILSMTLSPSEENVVCSTRTQQLYNLTLSAADLQGKVGHNEIMIDTLGLIFKILRVIMYDIKELF